ncbi:MAG TPA: hypothetical protein VNQ76_11405 [Planctomicrobium sp.]|nr:hypothetical protein [Planctomicrobium sp.]
MLLRQTLVLLSGISLLGICGCGNQTGDSPERFPVSGTVTFQGEPVPVGSIQFSPDTSKGNTGPTGYASISNGKFDTSLDGKGTVGGPHMVVIIGLDGKGDPKSDLPHGSPLFPEFQIAAELPASETVLNFDVPTPDSSRKSESRKK